MADKTDKTETFAQCWARLRIQSESVTLDGSRGWRRVTLTKGDAKEHFILFVTTGLDPDQQAAFDRDAIKADAIWWTANKRTQFTMPTNSHQSGRPCTVMSAYKEKLQRLLGEQGYERFMTAAML